MKVASLVSTEWSEQSRNSSQPHLSPAPSLSGSVRKYDEYREKPSPISTSATTSYFFTASSSQRASPQLPLSPPADDQRKCALPSISSLLEGMDNMPATSMPTPLLICLKDLITDMDQNVPAMTLATTAVASCLQHPPCVLAPVSQKAARLHLFHLDDHTRHQSAAQPRMPHINSALLCRLSRHLYRAHQSTPRNTCLSPQLPLTTLLASPTLFLVPHLPQPQSQQRLLRHHTIMRKRHIHEHTAHQPQ